MKDLTRNERYCMEWFERHGYRIKVKKQWNSKTVFDVNSKELGDFTFELPRGVEDIKGYMDRVKLVMQMRKETQRREEWDII